MAEESGSDVARRVGRGLLSAVININQQIHGYRQGHELLSTSITLSKTDQSTIDQLSDVAGPLRPGEIFSPYVSGYPLPSGSHYALARTWQDLTVARAGCVRTLSLLIPMAAWASTDDVRSLFDLLDRDGAPLEAQPTLAKPSSTMPLRPVPEFRAKELMEAMFLEEAKPVVLFDAPDPELVALRLLTALWPSLRSRFAVSTFALSPRKVEGRFFDLVFAPKDAKPRFSDWPGRRVDGQATHDGRHRWTGTIFARVFQDPSPRLMTDRQIGLIGGQDDNTFSALRIALLWEELHDKLDRAPTAALGLLDIANSRMSSNPQVALELVPLLRDATQRAVTQLSEREAWDFVGALVRKMQDVYPPSDMYFLADAAEHLARVRPDGALALLGQHEPSGAVETLLPAIAAGIADSFSVAESALVTTEPGVLARLICVGGRFAEQAASSPSVLSALAEAVPGLSAADLKALSTALLPLLVLDEHLPVAGPLIDTLEEDELLAEVRHLSQAGAFRAQSFFGPLTVRANELGAIVRLRSTLLGCEPSPARDVFLAATLRPTLDDVRWLLSESQLSDQRAGEYLLELLRSANDGQRHTLLSTDAVLARVSDEGVDQLFWAITSIRLSLEPFLATLHRVLPLCDARARCDLARMALERCLPQSLRDDEAATIISMFNILGASVDAGWVANLGLTQQIPSQVVSRNLMAMEAADPAARDQFILHINDIAEALATRYSLEMSPGGAAACASLIYAAQRQDNALSAAGRLLPAIFRARRLPLSQLIAATFPVVYQELSAKEVVPDLLRFIPFLDWDKCKAARRELVEAFMTSPAWAPEDFALTAYQCLDLDRIFNRAFKAYGGDKYLDRVLAGSGRLPPPCRDAAVKTIERLRGGHSGDT